MIMNKVIISQKKVSKRFFFKTTVLFFQSLIFQGKKTTNYNKLENQTQDILHTNIN